MPDSDSKVWFITGSSKGFGRIWAEAALARGDRVAATARDKSTLDELVDTYGDAVLALQLDVDDKAADDAAIAQAHEQFGRLDVVVNNAGYGHFGMVEEASEEEARAQIETNLFGALWITQAALPIMREQGSGHIIQVSSIGGVNAFPNVGLYHASKWGLEGFSQALAQEVAQFGIDVTLIEPIGFSTDWGGPSAKHSEPIAAYDEIRDARGKARGANKAGDPEATGKSILDIVDADEPPLRCFFGNWALGMIKDEYGKRIDNWEKWDWVAQESHGA
jgi:NAD(P)-dependent dehydrogenase (short-subunit alcohol dehydrogenase family)